MKKLVIPTILLGSLLATQAQFTPGNLVVLQAGDGTQTLASTGNEIFLDQFTTLGTFVNSLAIPTNGANSLLVSGTAASEGALSLSANGQYLVFAGYNTTYPYASSLPSSTSASVPRGVATVNAAGTYTLAATTATAFSGNNIRSAASDGNGNYWAMGATGGLNYMGTGSPSAISGTVLNSRVVQDIGGNLFYSTGSGVSPGGRGIYEVSGAPTSGAAGTNILLTTGTQFGAGSSPYDFAFNSSMTTAYVADSNEFTNSATVGGIEKWSWNGSAWVFDYSLSLGTNGAAGLAVDFSGANPIIYATSASGQSLFEIVDTNATAIATLLATAGANEVFRGLDWTPGTVPEPSTLALGGIGLAAMAILRRNRKV